MALSFRAEYAPIPLLSAPLLQHCIDRFAADAFRSSRRQTWNGQSIALSAFPGRVLQ